MLITLKRIFKLGWQNFYRDGGITVATIFILVLTIFLISSIFLLKEVSLFIINSLEGKVDISVYFKEDCDEAEILQIKEEISKIPEVKEIDYVSKEVALQQFIEKHKKSPVLMESLEELGNNPFLASLNIKAWKSEQYQAIVNFLENNNLSQIIEKIDYYQRRPVIERIFTITSFLKRTGIILASILVVCAILVTFNTVRLAILNSAEEIKIQRLVGASNLFIRGPFLVQGAISGIFASFISCFLFGFSCWILGPKFEVLFPELNLFNFFVKNLKFLILLQVFTSITLGVFSSLIAIRRYLRV